MKGYLYILSLLFLVYSRADDINFVLVVLNSDTVAEQSKMIPRLSIVDYVELGKILRMAYGEIADYNILSTNCETSSLITDSLIEGLITEKNIIKPPVCQIRKDLELEISDSFYESAGYKDLLAKFKNGLHNASETFKLDFNKFPKESISLLLKNSHKLSEQVKNMIEEFYSLLLLEELSKSKTNSVEAIRNIIQNYVKEPTKSLKISIVALDEHDFLSLIIGFGLKFPRKLETPSSFIIELRKQEEILGEDGYYLNGKYNGVTELEHLRYTNLNEHLYGSNKILPQLTENGSQWFTWRAIICMIIVGFLTLLETCCAWRDVRKATNNSHQPQIPVYHQLGAKAA